MKVSSGPWLDWEVTLRSNGRNLPEYDVQHNDIDTETNKVKVALYIEATVDQPFQIVATRPTQAFRSTRMKCTVDGRSLGNHALRPRQQSRSVGTYVENDNGVLRNRSLVFGNLTVHEDSTDTPAQQLDNLGTIQVSLIAGCHYNTHTENTAVHNLSPVAVGERTKKGMIGMSVMGGAATPLARSARRSSYSNFMRTPYFPELVVTFKYRSIDLLMAHGIVSRPSLAMADTSDHCRSSAEAGASEQDKSTIRELIGLGQADIEGRSIAVKREHCDIIAATTEDHNSVAEKDHGPTTKKARNRASTSRESVKTEDKDEDTSSVSTLRGDSDGYIDTGGASPNKEATDVIDLTLL